MEQNDFSQWEFVRVIWNNEVHVDFDTFCKLSGERRSTLHRKISQLPDVQFFLYKNRKYYKLAWALHVHQHFKQAGIA